MDASIAKKTQDTLGKVIKKPPLTDKLLSKPPFRFLHDIITEVIKNTGFLKGLYSADELNSANVKEKDAKIAFLQKAIDVVAIVSGASLSVRPSKIVAGHEPEKTNEFLQALGKAVISKKSSSDAVKTVLSGGKAGESKTKDRSRSRDREKSKEPENEKKEDKRKDSAKSKGKDGDRKKREDSGKKDKDKENDKENEPRRKDRSRDKDKRDKEPEKEKINIQKKEVESSDVVDPSLASAEQEDEEVPPNRMPRPTSAKGQRRRPAEGEGDDFQESEGVTGTDSSSPVPTEQMNGIGNDDHLPPQVAQSRQMARPSSARPAPPKIKKQQDELEDQVGRIGSGKQVTNVIVDDGKDLDDDDDTFVVEDPSTMQNHVDSTPSNESLDQESEHGGLVRKILETKKELEGSNDQQPRTKQDKSAPLMSDAARRKERELAQKEIEKLRKSIQTLTRSANPLGKIMDYVQEDVDSMNKELEMWRTENKNHSVALKREQSITDNEIEPLRAQLQELESEISEMVDKISTVKCNILKNDERIQKMLSSISFTS
ncbi:predicted protein [Nematostella vectensis]|uniref:TRAF3-interacting protein 1 n=1 Tax=Nematostella vectensis TaxID=45351 RepID=A7RXQ3_NEMVE|nr:predicted protein [Nematostella vectensis]|eukprot:XP_001635881.1 predicted protein [Nematostella vectensis]